MWRTPRAVAGILPLGDDAFQTKLACMTKYERPVFLDVFVQLDARPSTRDQAGERSLAHLQRIAPEVLPVQLDQVERIEEHGMVMAPVPNPVEGCDTVLSASQRLCAAISLQMFMNCSIKIRQPTEADSTQTDECDA